MSLQDLIKSIKGGMTSGNFGHGGRPGKHGGSAPGGGHSKFGFTSDMDWYDKADIIAEHREENPIKQYSGVKGHPLLSQEEMSNHYDSYVNDLCPGPSCMSIKMYTKGSDEKVNSLLRSGGDTSEYKMIDYIDEAMDKGPRTQKDMTVMRGVNTRSLFDKLEPGSVFEDKGFTSTTINPEVAKGFSKPDVTGGEQGYRLKIKVPKGSKGLYIDNISDYPRDEQEFLLPRGSKFKVISKGSREIVLELQNE